MAVLDDLCNSAAPLAAETLAKMDRLFGFSRTRNTEILHKWITLCVTKGRTGE